MIDRVLMLEDSSDDARLLELQLRKQWPNITIVRVETEAAFRRALDDPDSWDVVISDYSLPSFSAIGALQILEAHERDIPCLVVSGTIDEERASEVLRSGAVDFLSKGRWTRLVPAIEREVNDARSRHQRRLAERRLAEEHERTDFAMKAAGVGVWERRADGAAERWSSTMEMIHGVAEGAFSGRRDDFLRLLHEGDRDRVRHELDAGFPVDDEFSLSYRVVWPDRTVRWIVQQGRTFVSRQDGAVRSAGVAVDVTERQLLEERLNHAQKMESVGNLAGGIAHDFNNLLTVISGYCELIAAQVPDNTQALADIGEIAHAARSASAMTRQLLAFSRRQVLSPRVVELNHVVTNLRAMLGRLIEASVELEFVLTDDATHVRVDPTQVEQILVNLVVNARDAMPDGGRVRITTARLGADSPYLGEVDGLGAGDHVALAVQDTGSGIPPDVQARMFEPFYTTKDPGRGTGLGLSTVYGIVKQSLGGLSVESEVGEGTSFIIYLPAVAADSAEDIAAPTHRLASLRGVRVLVVDDDQALRRFSERALAELGCVPAAVGSYEQAVAYAKDTDRAIDIALVDVMMPDRSGPMFGEWLRVHRPGVRVLYTSGYPSDEVARAGLVAGSAFLQKPFSQSTLDEQLRRTLGRAS